jgi:ubiquinone/menaquinone biosynthesis C-methylase UbiE
MKASLACVIFSITIGAHKQNALPTVCILMNTFLYFFAFPIRMAFVAILLLNASCTQQQKIPTSKSSSESSGYSNGLASRDGIGKFYFGREISHVMGAAGSDWLERDERDQEENASLAVAKMPITAQSVVADIGAGTGYYSFKIAQRVPQGKVYAVDIQDEMLMIAADQKRALGDTIVELVKSTDRSVNLPLNSIDLAIMVDVYHELEFPKEILQSLYIALKPTGKLLLIEYRGEDPSIPIKPLHKTTVDQLNKELQSNGFKLQQRGDFLPVQHFLVYEKK